MDSAIEIFKRVLLSLREVICDTKTAYNGGNAQVSQIYLGSKSAQYRGKLREYCDSVIIQYMAEAMKLTKQQTSVLIGTILGDGFLQKTGEKNARLRLEHSQKQKDYVLWKGMIFGRLFQGKPSLLERIHPISKTTYKYCRWQSSTCPAFGKWRKYFYPNGKKIIPNNIGNFLTEPISLAVWYMDDGYFNKIDRNSYIYLGRILLSEAEILQKAINKNFAILVTIYDKKNKGFALFFGAKETKELQKIIKPFIIESLQYKLFNPVTT
jgi:hypothetical protein